MHDGLRPLSRRSARLQAKAMADEFVLPSTTEKNIFDICLEKQEAEKKAAIKIAKKKGRRRKRPPPAAESSKDENATQAKAIGGKDTA